MSIGDFRLLLKANPPHNRPEEVLDEVAEAALAVGRTGQRDKQKGGEEETQSPDFFIFQFRIHFSINIDMDRRNPISLFKTLQELQMLSTVTLYCQVTKIVMNSGVDRSFWVRSCLLITLIQSLEGHKFLGLLL